MARKVVIKEDESIVIGRALDEYIDMMSLSDSDRSYLSNAIESLKEAARFEGYCQGSDDGHASYQSEFYD